MESISVLGSVMVTKRALHTCDREQCTGIVSNSSNMTDTAILNHHGRAGHHGSSGHHGGCWHY